MSAAVFQAKYEDLNNAKKANKEVEYLNSIKTDQFTMEIKHFYYIDIAYKEKISKVDEVTGEKYYKRQVRSKFNY